jgi:hypothetical protein
LDSNPNTQNSNPKILEKSTKRMGPLPFSSPADASEKKRRGALGAAMAAVTESWN